MKHLLLTAIAAVLLVGCGTTAPDISIHDAASEGNIEAIKQHSEQSLIDAAWKGNIEAVKQHLADGVDVNAKDEYDWTPLHWAAGATEGGMLGNRGPRDHKEIAELLIAKGADVNAKAEDGETPLDLAEQDLSDYLPENKTAKKEIADLLRKHGGKTAEELNSKEESSRR